MSIGSVFVEALIAGLYVLLTILDHAALFLTSAYQWLFGWDDKKKGRGTTTRKTVAIVGGNFAGLSALWELAKHRDRFRIVLIDQKEFFEYTPGVLRLFCDPKQFTNMAGLLPRDKTNAADEVIQGRVIAIAGDNGEKVLSYVDPRNESQPTQTLEYDYVILATGSTYNYPVTAPKEESSLKERQEGWNAAHRRLCDASKILILGGGAVGVELAAEIVDYFPQKNVTIVDASPKLVPLFKQQVGDYATKWLSNRGVDLVLGKFLDSWDNTTCRLKDGTVLKADIVYVCFGDRPNSQFCAPSASKSSTEMTTDLTSTSSFQAGLDRRKCIIVSKTMQLSSASSRGCIFACGDVATPPTDDEKQAFQAETQGIVAAKNVARVERQQKLIRYPEDIAKASQIPLIFVLSLGRYDGVLGFNELVINGPITAVAKWGLEFTKVMQMHGRPFGKLIWSLAEYFVLFLSRTVVKPSTQASQVTKVK